MAVEYLASHMGVKSDDLRVLIVLFIHVFCSTLEPYFKIARGYSPLFRASLLMAVGFLSSCYLFGLFSSFLQIPIIFILYSAHRFCTDSKKTLLVSFLSFVFLVGMHAYRYFTDYHGNYNSIINVMMIQIPRNLYFYLFICNQLTAGTANGQPPLIPSFYDYFCFMFNYSGLMTSPVFSFEEHLRLINDQNEELPEKKQLILQKIGMICVAIAVYVLGMKFDGTLSLSLSKEFSERFILIRLLYFVWTGFHTRIRFYIAWLVAEIININLGFFSQESQFKNYLSNIDIFVLETSPSPKFRTAAWNTSIALWLRHCFYTPMNTALGFSKENAQLLTFMLSAFWHGFYPVYYVVMFLIFTSSHMEKMLFKSPYYSVYLLIVCKLQFEIAGTMWHFYEFDKLRLYLKANWDLILLLFVVPFVVLSLLPKKRGQRERVQ